eukprot:2692555-Rhodomonas_salina.2
MGAGSRARQGQAARDGGKACQHCCGEIRGKSGAGNEQQGERVLTGQNGHSVALRPLATLTRFCYSLVTPA